MIEDKNIIPKQTYEERKKTRNDHILAIAERNPRGKMVPCTTEESIAIAELAIGFNTQSEALRGRLGLDIDIQDGMNLLREGAVHIIGLNDVMHKMSKLTGRRVGSARSFRAIELMKKLMKSSEEKTEEIEETKEETKEDEITS